VVAARRADHDRGRRCRRSLAGDQVGHRRAQHGRRRRGHDRNQPSRTAIPPSTKKARALMIAAMRAPPVRSKIADAVVPTATRRNTGAARRGCESISQSANRMDLGHTGIWAHVVGRAPSLSVKAYKFPPTPTAVKAARTRCVVGNSMAPAMDTEKVTAPTTQSIDTVPVGSV
jgi:hypothetical protein